MFATGSEALSSQHAIAADTAGIFAGRRFAPGARAGELSRMFGIVAAIANKVLVLPARNSLTNGHLLVYRAGLRLMTFSRNLVGTSLAARLSTGGYWSSGGMAFQFSEGMYHG
jgi:hypothetical protein